MLLNLQQPHTYQKKNVVCKIITYFSYFINVVTSFLVSSKDINFTFFLLAWFTSKSDLKIFVNEISLDISYSTWYGSSIKLLFMYPCILAFKWNNKQKSITCYVMGRKKNSLSFLTGTFFLMLLYVDIFSN